MKKYRILAASILSLAMLAGCTTNEGRSRGEYDPDADTTGNEVDTPTPTPAEIPPVIEPEETPTPTPADIDDGPVFDGYESSEKEIAGFLDGTWYLHEGANMIEAPDGLWDHFEFNADTMTAKYTMAYADETAYFDFELKDAYPDVPGQYNLLYLTATGATEGFPYDIKGQVDTFMIIPVRDGMGDRLLIQQVGNGMSEFAYATLNEKRQADGDFWIFNRDYGETPHVGVNGMERERNLNKNDHFYAIRYSDYGSECSLQEVEPLFVELEMEDESLADVICFGWSDNGHPFNTVNYDIKGKEMLANSGAFLPGLVEVTTDADGKITEILDCPSFAYGYFCEAANGAPDIDRDDAVYGPTDKMFLGDWLCKDDGVGSLQITTADPQTGGYYLLFDVYRLCVIEAYANIDGNMLSINQGYINYTLPFAATLEIKGDELRVTVTESDFEYLPVGTVMLYEKK